MGGLLTGLPALCVNGLLSGLGRHLSLRRTGFYEAMHVLLVLGFMALAWIRRPEGLRHVPPGELGKVVGLDRVPEVKTLRRKVARMANDGDPRAWMQEELAANPLLHRFVIICDREGATNRLFSKLWEQRIGVISYRKNVKDVWPESEFSTVEVAVPGGGSTKMSLASRQTKMGVSDSSLPVLEVRRLSQTGHQTAIISSAMLLENPVIAGRMFSRWCQENSSAT